jgi:hypothetical protein
MKKVLLMFSMIFLSSCSIFGKVPDDKDRLENLKIIETKFIKRAELPKEPGYYQLEVWYTWYGRNNVTSCDFILNENKDTNLVCD